MNVLSILKPMVGRMPLYVRLLYLVLAEPSVSKRRKAYLSACLLYMASPIDLVPGIIPVVGQLDDIIFALAALVKVLKRMPPDKRDDVLSRAGLRMETLDSDLDAAKAIGVYLATRPVAYVGHAVGWTGRKAGGLVKGLMKIGRKRTRR